MARGAPELIALDPGTDQTGFVRVEPVEGQVPIVLDHGIVPNDVMRQRLDDFARVPDRHVAIEMIASYGMPVGREVFETCVWIGRFIEASDPLTHSLWYRKAVKLHLCGSSRAKDANIRQAILDRYPRTGGGKTPQVGTKSKPGLLYGMKSHAWAALGVALTCLESREGWPT